eukprot:scaffold10708_cov50-Attheya_sp.AAC.3
MRAAVRAECTLALGDLPPRGSNDSLDHDRLAMEMSCSSSVSMKEFSTAFGHSCGKRNLVTSSRRKSLFFVYVLPT